MPEINSTQNIRATVVRQEVLIDQVWNLAKNIMFGLGGIAILAWLIWLGYWWGGSGCYTCTQNQPASVVTPKSQTEIRSPEPTKETADLKPATEKSSSKPAEPSPVPAPQAPAPQVTASAISASVAPTPLVSPIVMKFPERLIVELKGEAPQLPVQTSSASQPKSCERHSGAERLSCERWARLR